MVSDPPPKSTMPPAAASISTVTASPASSVVSEPPASSGASAPPTSPAASTAASADGSAGAESSASSLHETHDASANRRVSEVLVLSSTPSCLDCGRVSRGGVDAKLREFFDFARPRWKRILKSAQVSFRDTRWRDAPTPKWRTTGSAAHSTADTASSAPVIRPLGKGGFAQVYLGAHAEIESLHVAIKVLHSSFRDRELLVERFRREARLLAMLRNRHAVRLIDFGFDENEIPYLVMEYVPGRRSTAYCAPRAPSGSPMSPGSPSPS